MTTATAEIVRTATRKATPMEQWHDYTLRAQLGCRHRKCDDGTLRVGRLVYCGPECGNQRVITTAGRVPA